MPECPSPAEIIAVTRAMCRRHGLPLALEDLCVSRMEHGLAEYGPSAFASLPSREWLRAILEELIDSFNTGGPLRACRFETPIGIARTSEALLSVWAAYQAAPSTTFKQDGQDVQEERRPPLPSPDHPVHPVQSPSSEVAR